MNNRVSTIDELVMLEAGSVLRGPDWHGEVYVKVSDVEYATIGTENLYRAGELQPRGPYSVLYNEGADPRDVHTHEPDHCAACLAFHDALMPR